MHHHHDPAGSPSLIPHDGRIVVPTPEGPRRIGHAHFWERAFTRRQFVRGTAATAGLALGAGLVQPALAFNPFKQNAAPKPIPGGTDLFGLLGLGSGPLFHFFFPALGQEVSLITDFNGFVAAAEIQGTGIATNTVSHGTTTLTFDADMRFMDGLYIGKDGHPRNGTFGFIWLDLFTGQFDQQIHDFNPGITPSGLFWTIPIPRDSVSIHLGAGTASMQMQNLSISDFGNIVNAIGAQNPPIPPIDSTVSFDVRWQGKSSPTRLSDVENDFRGVFVDSDATIAWSANQPSTNFQFVSAAADTSTAVSGVIGFEHNGRFFKG